VVPVGGGGHGEPLDGAGDEAIARSAGLDLLGDVPAPAAEWLAGQDGPLVLGNYVYADGAANVRVSTAVDALTVRLLGERHDVALAFLATPTDVFAVPGEARSSSQARAYAGRTREAKLAGRPLRTLSGGRLLRRAYLPGADPGINDRPDRPAGPQLRTGQAAAALAGRGRPGPAAYRVDESSHRPPGPARC